LSHVHLTRADVGAFLREHPHGADRATVAEHLGITRQAVDLAERQALRWFAIAWLLDEWRARFTGETDDRP